MGRDTFHYPGLLQGSSNLEHIQGWETHVLKPSGLGCSLHPSGHQPSLKLPLFKQLVLHRSLPEPLKDKKSFPSCGPGTVPTTATL